MTASKEDLKSLPVFEDTGDSGDLADKKRDEPDARADQRRQRRYSRAYEVLEASSSRQWAWLKNWGSP